MLEILREDNALYKWRIGKTANHMGYVKSNENGKFQNFEPCLTMVNWLFFKLFMMMAVIT
jgi:hypothetical protein